MKLKQRGQYYELPIIGARISKFVFDGLVQIGFDNNGNDKFLDIHGEFKLVKYNQEKICCPRDRNTWIQLIDLWNKEVKEALADNSGNLFITFENEIEIIINDSPYETWHFTMIDHDNSNNNLYIHGGVGRTIWQIKNSVDHIKEQLPKEGMENRDVGTVVAIYEVEFVP